MYSLFYDLFITLTEEERLKLLTDIYLKRASLSSSFYFTKKF